MGKERTSTLINSMDEQRQLWVQKVTAAMAVVILLATGIIIAGILAGYFSWADATPIFVMLFIILPAWWGAGHGGWKWARVVPGGLCLLLGVYGTFNFGFTTLYVLFYAIAVVLGGMLNNFRVSFYMVFISVLSYAITGYLHDGFTTDGLVSLIMFTFILIGFALLRWLAASDLQRALLAQVEINTQLKNEIARVRQTELLLKESENKFRNITQMLPLGIHLYSLQADGELNLSGYNPAADQILGLDHAPLVGKTIQQAFPGLAKLGIAGVCGKLARSGGVWRQERLDAPDPAFRGSFEIQAFETEAGKVAVIFEDITRRVEDSEELRLSEEKFSTAFITSPDSVNINRMIDGVYIDVNQGFTRLMGYTREEVVGKSSLELNIWANPHDRERLVEGLIQHGVVENLEARFRRKNGDVGIGLMSARVIQIRGEKCILSMTRDITDWIQAQLELIETHTKLERAYEATLIGWTRALQLREHETANHSWRVVEMTVSIARRLGIEGEELTDIRRGALLHDIGKLGIPDEILLKPDNLTDDEWEIMRKHPEFARILLDEIEYLRPSIPIPYCHHEKWDGSGYPQGLVGEAIPLPARIFAIVDVFDALTHDRPYRPAMSEAEARQLIIDGKGKHFDPVVADLFLDGAL